MAVNFANIRRCIGFAWGTMVLAFALVLFPLGLLAAPYADCVIDARTGEVLRATNADARLHPASLTKMMTLYIAFQAIEHGEISLDTMVTVSKFAASQPPSRLGLRPGQQIALRYLIRAAAIKSANDAAAAIGDAIEGNRDAFAARMNRTAKALGMTRTTFRNPNGLTADGHLSTARDMTTLGRRLFYDFPQYYSLFSRRTADAGVAQVASTNRRFLDSYEGADGIKTGYTVPAGFNLVASAQRGDVRIIAAIFGGTSTAMRNQRMAQLLDLGFSKAPGRATVQKPPAIAYDATAHGSGGAVQVAEADTGDAPLTDDSMAEAVASSVKTDAPPAGKTIRLNTAVAQSELPPMKGAAQPDAGTEVAAADTADNVDESIVEDGAAMANGTDALTASMQDTIAQAVQEAQAEPAPEAQGFAQTAKPQPETLALAAAAQEDAAATDPAAPAPADTPAMAALAQSVMPVLHHNAPADASAAPTVEPAVVQPAPVQLADAAGDVAAPLSAPPALADAGDAGGMQALPTALPSVPAAPQMAAAAPAQEAPQSPDAAPVEPAKPTIVLASAAAASPAPEDLEVVTRVSTSGGREWGINVGTFSSRYNAEKQLLQTALVEMESLNDALRKVTQRKGAFDANFVGMTEASAEQACQRLAARGTDCKVLSP